MSAESEVKMPATAPGASIMASQNRQVYAPHRVSWNRKASFTRGFLPAPKLKLITGWPPWHTP